MKNALILPVTLAALFAISLPASAAMEVLNDDDLDSITAAGQPTVVISKNGSASQKDLSVQSLNIVEDAQHGLRALAITNVVGEAQLLVNLNVISIAGNVAGADQRNFAVQSWGSTLPKISETVEGESAVETEIDFNPRVNPNCTNNCRQRGDIELEVKEGTQIGVTNIASDPKIEIASASGDVIVDGKEEAEVFDGSVASLNFEPNAQTDLAALFIANIAGRTQAAFNVNIMSSTLNLFPSTDAPFTEPAISSTQTLRQTNSGVQFRGTPINAASWIQVDHTPNP